MTVDDRRNCRGASGGRGTMSATNNSHFQTAAYEDRIMTCSACGSDRTEATVRYGSYLIRCAVCGEGIVSASFMVISQANDVFSAHVDPGFGQEIADDAYLARGPLRQIAEAVSLVADQGQTVLLRGEPVAAGVTAKMIWLTPWQAVDEVAETDAYRTGWERQLRKEVGTGHVLENLNARLIGRRYDRDTALFLLDDERIAKVHLTWRQDQKIDPHWPETTIYAGVEDWQARGLAADHAEWQIWQ